MKTNDMHRHGYAYTLDVERGLYTVTLPWGETFSDPWEGVVLRWIDDQVEEMERRRDDWIAWQARQ
jgi:hypothetical protein